MLNPHCLLCLVSLIPCPKTRTPFITVPHYVGKWKPLFTFLSWPPTVSSPLGLTCCTIVSWKIMELIISKQSPEDILSYHDFNDCRLLEKKKPGLKLSLKSAQTQVEVVKAFQWEKSMTEPSLWNGFQRRSRTQHQSPHLFSFDSHEQKKSQCKQFHPF